MPFSGDEIREYRAFNRARGLCACGRERMPDRRQCATCTARGADRLHRYQMRHLPKPVVFPRWVPPVHLLVHASSGITAQCVRHLHPESESVSGYVLTADVTRVSCVLCKTAEVS